MHIVVFTGGVSTQPQDSVVFFQNCPKVDFVIAADSGLETLELYNQFYKDIDFTPDYVLGDMDSISDKNLLQKYAGKVQTFPVDKDYTDTELALEKAHESKDAVVTLIGGAGGFCDHFLGIMDTFSTENHADYWLCGNQILCFLKKNEMLSIKNLALTDRISVARTTDSYSEGMITSEGLEWESNVFRKKGMPSISNRISREAWKNKTPVKFFVKQGKFLVIVPVNAILEKVLLCCEEE